MPRRSDDRTLIDQDESWEALAHTLPRRASSGDHTASPRREMGTERPGRSRRVAEVRAPVVRPAFVELPQIRPGSAAASKRKRAATKRATVLSRDALEIAEDHIRKASRSVYSDILKLRLSRFAGMRAQEISELPLQAMLTASGAIDSKIQIRCAKTRGRFKIRPLDMHDSIAEALHALLIAHPDATHAAFSIGRDGILRHQSPSCVTNWFFRLYKNAGLIGCSSHSGRRTFATEFSRKLALHNCSMRDLQDAMGHASLVSTECYMEPSQGMRALVRSLGE